jgi:hypothetical protein
MLSTFTLMTAEINSKSRADWRACFCAGADSQNWEIKFDLYKHINHMGSKLNIDKSSEEIFQDYETWKELFHRLVSLPRLVYLGYNTGVFTYVDKNFPTISEGNFDMCVKFYILGSLFSVHERLLKPSNNLHSP